MRLVVKKLEIADLGQLQSLVIEHLDGIESGLTVLDSRLLLGHATIDIVAIDTEGSLVLVTAGFTADEEMLMKAVDAYSWCLEYPDAIRRLYPSVEISAARPPRLMFVVERLPDAFHRKIKQLGFSEVDCVEFRYLDVSGTQAAYFDTIARMRRGPGLAEFTPAPIARRVADLQPRRAPEPMMAERPVEKLVDRGDKVVPLASAPSTARATSVRLQKMLNTNGSGHGTGIAPVIEIATRAAAATPRLEIAAPRAEAAHVETPKPRIETPAPRILTPAPRIVTPAPRIETPAPSIELPVVEIAAPTVEPLRVEIAAPPVEVAPVEIVEIAAPAVEAARPQVESPAPRVETPGDVIEPIARVTLRKAVSVPAPAAVAAAAAPQAPEPRISFAEIAKELLGAAMAGPRLEAPAVIPRPAVEEITRATLEDIAAAAAGVNSAVAVEDVPADLEIRAAVDTLVKGTSAKPVAAPRVAPVVEDRPAPVVAATPKPVFTAPKPVAAASKPVVAAPKPAAAAPAPVAAAPKVVTAPAPAPAPAPTPVAAAPAPKPAEPEPPAQNLPQEFEGLKFPNDGVLTRQWMEFLNQMASSK